MRWSSRRSLSAWLCLGASLLLFLGEVPRAEAAEAGKAIAYEELKAAALSRLASLTEAERKAAVTALRAQWKGCVVTGTGKLLSMFRSRRTGDWTAWLKLTGDVLVVQASVSPALLLTSRRGGPVAFAAILEGFTDSGTPVLGQLTITDHGLTSLGENEPPLSEADRFEVMRSLPYYAEMSDEELRRQPLPPGYRSWAEVKRGLWIMNQPAASPTPRHP